VCFVAHRTLGDFDMLSIVRISRLNWIGHVCRMGSNRRVNQVFNNNSQGRRLRGRTKNRGWNCVQTHNNKMQNYKLEREVKEQS